MLGRNKFVDKLSPCLQVRWKVAASKYSLTNTVQWHYNGGNFLLNPHKIHPTACPLDWDMGYNLWFDTLIDILLQSTQSTYEIWGYVGPCYNGTRPVLTTKTRQPSCWLPHYLHCRLRRMPQPSTATALAKWLSVDCLCCSDIVP